MPGQDDLVRDSLLAALFLEHSRHPDNEMHPVLCQNRWCLKRMEAIAAFNEMHPDA